MKQLLSIFVCVSGLLVASIGFSQQGNVWTFGVNARVDFGTTPPTVGTSPLSSYEGCASICDNSGSLIFYTDGISLWDNTNTLISNGLMGDWSAAQSGILVPEPGTTPGALTNRYYVFSIPQLGNERARYTIYDANTHSVSNLNSTLPDHAIAGNTTESITVAKHCNGIDYWVITHEIGNNRLKAYQVTNSGILPPVVTDLGPTVPTTTTSPQYINTACCMKISPSNSRLAFIVRRTNVCLFDFNPSTGVFSNPVNVATGTGRDYYGVEFSPNSNVLYYTDAYTAVFKYNILTASTASLTSVAGSYTNLYAGLQLAPNGCIYLAKDGDSNLGNLNQTTLGRIDDPDNYAGSAYIVNGLTLAAGTSVKCGLPNIIPSLSSPAISISGDNSICMGESTVLTAAGASNYSWSPAGTLSSSSGSSVTATPATNTTYTVSGTDISGCSTSTLFTVTVNSVPTITASNNGPLCEGQTLDLSSASQIGVTYNWTGPNSFTSGLQNPQLTDVTSVNGGVYTVTVSENGCSSSASTTVNIGDGANSIINPNGSFCADASPVTLSSMNPGGTWSGSGITDPVTGEFDPALAAIGDNTVSYTTSGICGGTDSVIIVVNPIPTPGFTVSETSGCSPLNVQFANTTTPPGASVLWDLGNGAVSSVNNPNTVYSDPGCYDISLTVTDNNGCTGTTTYASFVCVNSDPSPVAHFHIDSPDEPGTDSLFYFVNSSVNAVSFQWDFGDHTQSSTMNPEHSYSETGSYLVELIVYNASGCSDTAYASITIRDDLIFYVPNTFTPNGNGTNELFFPVLTSGIDLSGISLLIFDRWGEIIFETTDANAGWDGTYKDEIVQDGTYVWKLLLKDLKDDKQFEITGHVNVLK